MKSKYFGKVDSTNAYGKLNLEYLDDKTVVYTSHQTQGRGRFNRKWVGLGAGNLYMSLILKPSNKFEPVYANLTQYTCLSLVELLDTYGVKAQIKWPNDILVNDKKIAGILAEAVYKEGELRGIIIGIGLNLNASEKDLAEIDKPATALNIETGHGIDNQIFLNKFYKHYFEGYKDFLTNGFKSIKKDYESYCNFLNKKIELCLAEDISEVGVAQKIDNDGALIVNGIKYYTGDITNCLDEDD